MYVMLVREGETVLCCVLLRSEPAAGARRRVEMPAEDRRYSTNGVQRTPDVVAGVVALE